jgi:uncharacterized delta-60 repeat protein
MKSQNIEAKRFSLKAGLSIAGMSMLGSSIAAVHPGDLDSRFGASGVVDLRIANLAPNCTEHLAVDESNRPILAYNTVDGGAITALSPSGDVDTTFGSAGSIALAHTLCDMKIDSKNRLVALTEVGAGFELSRYSSNGMLDTTFGVSGYLDVVSGAGDIDGVAMHLTNDGSIVVIGTDYSLPGEYKMLASKIAGDGSLDTSFGTHGLATVSVSAGMEMTFPRGIATDSKGLIYLNGYTSRDDAVLVSSLARLTPDGNIDTTFGGGKGYIQTDADPASGTFHYTSPCSISVDAHDRILVSGSASDGFTSQFFVVRYLDDGTMDASFNGGIASYSVTGAGETDSGNMLIDARERIIITGTGVAPSSDSYLAVARFNGDGTIDTSFSLGGTELLATSAWNGYSAFTGDQDILVFGDAPDGASILLNQVINNPPMVVTPPSGF